MKVNRLIYCLMGIVSYVCFSAILGCSTVPIQGKTIERKKAKLYVVGIGPGAADLINLRAIDQIKRADVVICGEATGQKFGKYLKGKKRLDLPEFPYWQCLEKKCWDPSDKDKERCRELLLKRRERANLIRKYIKEGKKVALLEGGDPCLFGCLRWIKQEFGDEEFEVVPGISSFNVANALLKREVVDAYVADWQTRSVLITTPARQGDRRDSIENLARHRATMVFFMSREFEEKVLPQLKKYYPLNTPVAIVYKAGNPGEEQVIKGTLGSFPFQPQEQKWLRLIYVGEFLKDASIKN